ncbi:MAG: LptE family protein [Candidatus Poribacteria bacterium]|nr:LptE family protein [Candidatus Poribacteria bacterium]
MMIAAFAWTSGFLLVFGGCGYHSVSPYLNHIDTITIVPVTNQTQLFELGDEMTTALQSRFRSKWTTGQDSELEMTLLEYDYEPLRFDVNNQPERWRMYVRVNYRFYDNVENRIITDVEDYEFHYDFWTVTGRGEDPEDEQTARGNLIKEFTDALYYTIAEQW